MKKNLVIEGAQALTLVGLQALSVCLGTMAIGGIVYAFYRIIADNIV